MLDFDQIHDLINTAVQNHNDETTYRHWLNTGSQTGQSYNEYMKSIDRAQKQSEDHRSAAEIIDDNAAIFAAAGM